MQPDTQQYLSKIEETNSSTTLDIRSKLSKTAKSTHSPAVVNKRITK